MNAGSRRAAIGATLASVAMLSACSATPAASAEPVTAQQVESLLAALRTGPAAFERTVVVDSRSVGGAFGDFRLNGRYTELHHRESSRRARIVYRSSHRPAGYMVTRYDGETSLAAGDEPARRATGPLLRLLAGMVPVPIRAADVADIETAPAENGGRRVHVRFKRPDPSRLIGREGREFRSPRLAGASRRAQETADLLLAADGGLLRLTQRFRATLDAGAIAPGLPMIGPQGIIRLRFSAVLEVAPTLREPVPRPAVSGTVADEGAFELLPEEAPEPAAGASDPDAAPSGDARAIALARRANGAFRGIPAFTAALGINLPGGSGVVRVQVGLRDGLAEIVRTSLGAGVEVVSVGRSQYSFDEFGRCWDRDPLSPDPFSPWEPGRAPVPLRGSRFFAPEPAGRVVRIVAERVIEELPTRVEFTLDRRSGRLLAVESLLTKGRVTIRPDLTVPPPTPVC